MSAHTSHTAHASPAVVHGAGDSKRSWAPWLVQLLRILLCLVFGLPLVFMIVSSFKPDTQIFGDVSSINAFLQEIIAKEVGSRVDNPPGSGPVRVQFVASQLVGVVMARYILELDPFKSLPVEQIAATIAPNLQRYLTGDLPGFP